MRRIMGNPYLIFPLGAALVVAALVSWSFLQGDGPSVNTPFLVFVLLLPLIAALYSFSKGVRARGGWWIVRWFGTTVLSVLASVAVLFASMIFIPAKANEAYNYVHFKFASYGSGEQRRVKVGGEALDATLYTLDENKVRLSDLWKERPIVLEFGSVT